MPKINELKAIIKAEIDNKINVIFVLKEIFTANIIKPINHIQPIIALTTKYNTFENVFSRVSEALIIKCSLKMRVKNIIGARNALFVREVATFTISAIDKASKNPSYILYEYF